MKSSPGQRMRDIQHFGEEGGVTPVIDHAATSTFLNPGEMEQVFTGEKEGCYLYSRHSNPTVNAFAQKVAAMEDMPAAFGVASGMAAISASLLQILDGPGHIVCSNTVYGGTWALFKNIFPKLGIEVSFVDPIDIKAWENAIRPETKVLYTETLSNPLLAVADLGSLSKLKKKHNLKFVVDNTFTPLLITPAHWGADVVVHSCTKYMSGASDLVGGAIASDLDFINQLKDVNSGFVMLQGPVMDARVAYELYSRLDHLPVRMQGHSRSAEFLSNKLVEQGISGVVYPGLQEHPQYELMGKQLNPDYGYGGMITLDVGSRERAVELAKKLQEQKFGLFAVSLGFTRTLMSCPASSTSSEIPVEEQEKMGLKSGLLRLSIGLIGDNQIMTERFLKCYNEVMKNN
jgi:methionine-gamma-lyase